MTDVFEMKLILGYADNLNILWKSILELEIKINEIGPNIYNMLDHHETGFAEKICMKINFEVVQISHAYG